MNEEGLSSSGPHDDDGNLGDFTSSPACVLESLEDTQALVPIYTNTTSTLSHFK